MNETRAWKEVRGLTENSQCKLCQEQRGLMVIAAAWAKEQNLLDQDMEWYQEKCKRGHVLENYQAKLLWDFEFNLQKVTTSRRPDLMLKEKQTKTI